MHRIHQKKENHRDRKKYYIGSSKLKVSLHIWGRSQKAILYIAHLTSQTSLAPTLFRDNDYATTTPSCSKMPNIGTV